MNVLRSGRDAARRVVCITALVIYVPLLFIVVQSFLQRRSSAQILEPGSLRLYFYRPGFLSGVKVRFYCAFGLVIIATTGRYFGFLMVRTDCPAGGSWSR
jgi:iron(III) transport system permease protein